MPFRNLAWLLVLALLAPLAAAQTEDFTVVVLPDTQHYSQAYPHIFAAQTRWIAANAAARNIRFVVGVGDIVNKGELTEQWQNADAAIRTLDQARVPYVLPVGNHDYKYSKPSYRDTTLFNRYFGPGRYKGYSWYRAGYPSGKNDNFYAVFSVGGVSYLVLALETFPREEALQWADAVLAANRDKRVIVTTHAYVYKDDSRIGRCDYASAESMGVGRDHDGDELWNRFVRRHANIIMVLNGHTHGVGRRTDLGDAGNRVNQMLADYQGESYGGNGYLRILKFRPALNRVEVSTYSPYRDAWRTDAANQFTLQMMGPGAGAGEVAGTVRTSSCAPISGAVVTAGSSSGTTDGAGAFRLPLLPSSYTVRASASGYDAGSKSVQVNGGMAALAEFFLAAGTTSGSCPAPSSTPAVNLCSPANGGSSGSPVAVSATAASPSGIRVLQVYVDGAKVHEQSSASLDKSFSMAAGTRRVTVQAMDNSGNVFKQTAYVDVGTTSSTAPASSCATPSTRAVNLCSPSDGATVDSPVRVLAAAPGATKLMQVYVDGSKLYETSGASLDVALSLAPGSRRLTVQGVDSSGSFKQTVYVTVR